MCAALEAGKFEQYIIVLISTKASSIESNLQAFFGKSLNDYLHWNFVIKHSRAALSQEYHPESAISAVECRLEVDLEHFPLPLSPEIAMPLGNISSDGSITRSDLIFCAPRG